MTSPNATLTTMLLCAAAMGCSGDPSGARAAVERFLDAHYVRIDLQASRALTTDLARHKVDQEIALTAGLTIDADTRMPDIHYRLLEERTLAEDATSFLYEATIVPPDADRFRRQLLVTTRRLADGWVITNYTEFPE